MWHGTASIWLTQKSMGSTWESCWLCRRLRKRLTWCANGCKPSRSVTGFPFLLENVVHVIPDSPAEYTDAGFLNALVDRTGCGLILDAYNLECDAHNHGFDIPSFLNELNATHVRELHVARGVEHNGFLLDVHSQLTRRSTVELAQRVVRQSAGSARVVVYEFMPEAVPGLGHDAIADELGRLRAAFRN